MFTATPCIQFFDPPLCFFFFSKHVFGVNSVNTWVLLLLYSDLTPYLKGKHCVNGLRYKRKHPPFLTTRQISNPS